MFSLIERQLSRSTRGGQTDRQTDGQTNANDSNHTLYPNQQRIAGGEMFNFLFVWVWQDHRAINNLLLTEASLEIDSRKREERADWFPVHKRETPDTRHQRAHRVQTHGIRSLPVFVCWARSFT